MPYDDRKQIQKDIKMKSKFTRKPKIIEPKIIEPKKVYKKPWENPQYDGLRPDRKAIPKLTEKERFIISCNTARKMEKLFGRKPWMEKFINENDQNQPFQKGLIDDI